jgi:trk system potassium uptake protein
MKGISAEAIEFDVQPGAAAAGRNIAEVDFPRGAVVGAILREDRVIMPRGADHIRVGDRVVVFAMPEAIGQVEQLFL